VLKSISVAALALTTGCYFMYPKQVPKVNGQLLVQGETMRIETHKEKRWGTCSDSDYKYDRCEIIHGKLKAPYAIYTAKAVYNGNTLRRSDFNELVYQDYAQRVKKVEDLKGTCRISLVPSVLAIATLALAYVGPLMSGNKFTDDQKKYIYIGGAAAGLGLGLLSYPLGGFACVKASRLAGNLFAGARETEWEAFDPKDFAEIEKLADDFNARQGAAPAPVEEAPVDTGEPLTE